MNKNEIELLEQLIKKQKLLIDSLLNEIKNVIVGRDDCLIKIITAIIAGGHILLEGMPGLAKTLIIRTIADCIQLDFQRIQFTPDLLPADITGTMIYEQQTSGFTVSKGPIFSNIVLADEINRAPAKAQSALLEAMQEHQVTIGKETYMLERPFFVLATQNPIDQEGTYQLPEAQLDRFIMKIIFNYQSKTDELEILRKYSVFEKPIVKKIMTGSDILELQKIAYSIFTDKKIEDYIVNLIDATRHPENYGLSVLKNKIQFGASPRATIYLHLCAKITAMLNGRTFVLPDDIKCIAADILRHRIVMTFEAEAEDYSTDIIIKKLLDNIEVP